MERFGRRAFARGLGAMTLLHGIPALAAPDQAIGTFPLSVAFAEERGQPVQDAAWLEGELAEVERLYAPLGIHVRAQTGSPLTGLVVHLETRADRDALTRACAPKVVNVFVVASLRDVDDGVTVRRGVHWRSRVRPGQRYLIVSAIAGPSVLAHELGHFFGNGHSTVMDNLMSYDRTGAEVFLDALQASTIRTSARAVLRSGEVVAVRAP